MTTTGTFFLIIKILKDSSLMKIKTKGKCAKCNELYAAAKAGAHLLTCALKSDILPQTDTDGYLVRISCAERPDMYWMFATIPKNASLGFLDGFLRGAWLECCGHLSKFTIDGHRYISHTESGNSSQSMKKQIDQLLSPGSTCEYVYDLGSSTYLEIHVVSEVPACPQKKVTIFMQNNPPDFHCELCKKTATNICSICGETICSSCCEQHSCVVDEGGDYILMPIVNSPRSGVCGYIGN